MNLAVIGIYIVFALVGLGLLAMVLFGVRSLAFGKVSPLAMVIVAIPALLLIVLGFVLGEWDYAAILTVFISLGLAVLALLVTGVKGIFT